MISTLDELLNDLKEELKEKVDGYTPYNFSVGKVVRGRTYLDDLENFLPAVWFTATEEVLVNLYNDQSENKVEVEIHGIVKNKKGDTDNLHKFLKDIKYFLYNDYSNTDNVTIKSTIIREGGINDELNIAEFAISIDIDYTCSTITL